MKLFLISFLLILANQFAKAQHSFVRLETSKGNITLLLYDETPLHKAMFLKSIKRGFYKNAAFNRVIKSFVSQAGQLDDVILEKEKLHPEIPLERIAAEIKPQLFHKKYALGAGRNDNPEKLSYVNQIYLVTGKPQTDVQLDALEQKKNRKIPVTQREAYKTIGGTPHLDDDYTVFGEVVLGKEVADAINGVATDKNDVPIEQVVFTAYVLSGKEANKLWKQIKAN